MTPHRTDRIAQSVAAQAVRDRLTAGGAQAVEPDILMPADRLIDLYGEDIRARAYTCTDPLLGEMMLRPDFTVGVIEAHLAGDGAEARYAYAGPVFRQQETLQRGASETLQAGLELLGGKNAVQDDAEVFAILADLTAPLGLQAVIGDIGLLRAAVMGLSASAPRKAALLRHLWRPRRFRELLERFSGRKPVPAARAKLLAALDAGADPFAAAGPELGLRSRAEITQRLARLQDDATDAPIPAREVTLLEQLMSLRDRAPAAAEQLRDIAVDMPAILPALGQFRARLEALAARGLPVEEIAFEASYGRTTLEYYDGFVFGLTVPSRPDLQPVVTGGRYDALTRAMGDGVSCPAVGAAIRMHIACAQAQEKGVAWP